MRILKFKLFFILQIRTTQVHKNVKALHSIIISHIKEINVTDLNFSNVIYNLEVHVGSVFIKQRKEFIYQRSSADHIISLFQLRCI